MATSKKFSELPAASSVGNGDLFAISHEDAQAETGYVSQKLTAAQAGQKMNGDTEYPTSLPSFPENSQNPFAALEKLNQDIIDLYPVSTASGSIATFSTSLALPLVGLSSTIVAQQAGTGTPSPSNPRAISGFSSVNVYVTGKNLFNLDKFLSDNNVSYTKDGEWFLFNLSNDLYNNKFDLLLDNYSVSFIVDTNRTTATNPRLRLFKNGGVEGEVNANSSITKAIDQISFNFSTAGTICCKVQAEFGTTTSYEPFGNTYTFTFGQTVYGGHFDNKGNLVVTHGIVDLASLSWTRTTNYTNPLFYASISDKKYSSVNSLCEIYENGGLITGTTALNNMQNYTFGAGNNANVIYVRDDSCSDVPSFETSVSGKYIVYELANPITLSITSQNIPTISGENNIFSDCGDVEVSYKQGIQEYIDAKIAATQALIL